MINRYYKKNKIEIEFQKIKNNQIHLKMCSKNNRQKTSNITTVESDVIPSTSRGMINSDDECPNSDDECPNSDDECPICLTKIDEKRCFKGMGEYYVE